MGEGNKMNTNTIYESEMTTDCTCIDENGYQRPNDCWGWCYQDAEQDVAYLIEEWVERSDTATDTVRIESNRMNWDGVSGYAVVDIDKLINTVKINAEYRLRFKLERNNLTIVRYSHDEPMGALFTVNFVPDDTERTH
jgi:hypothetical protein